MQAPLIAVLLACVCVAKVHDSHHTNIELIKPGTSIPNGAMKLRLRQVFMNDIAGYILPDLIAVGQNFVIPGESQSHFSFNSFALQGFSIGSLNIDLPTNQIEVVVSDLSLVVPYTGFSVFDRIFGIKISCSGHFWGSTSGTNVTITAGLTTDANNNLQFVNPQASINFGTLGIGQRMSNFFCKIGEDIVELFIGSISGLIENLIVQKLPGMLSTVVATKGNAVLAKLPINFISPPVIANGYVSVIANLLPTMTLTPAEDASTQIWLPKRLAGAKLPNRDIEFFIPTYTIDEALTLINAFGIFSRNISIPYNTSFIKVLFPSAYTACPACPMFANVHATNAPTVWFGNNEVNATLTNFNVALNAINPKQQTVPLLELGVNMTVSVLNFNVSGVNQSTLHFQIGVPRGVELSLIKSNIGPVNVGALDTLLDIVLEIAIPDFNQKFKGFTLPAIKGFYFEDLVVAPVPNMFTGALNVDFPPDL